MFNHMTTKLSILWLIAAAVSACSVAVPRDANESHLSGASSCTVSGAPTSGLGDVLFKILTTADSCPKDVLELRKLLQNDGLSLKPSLVGNRGFANPARGSFSFFEMVEGPSTTSTGTTVQPGEFIFGHFTGADGNGGLHLDRSPDDGKLMIELIVWDSAKEVFNF